MVDREQMIVAASGRALIAAETLLKALGNQKLLYGMSMDEIVAVKERVYRIAEMATNCQSRLVKPEFVRLKATCGVAKVEKPKAVKVVKKPEVKKPAEVKKPEVKPEPVAKTA